MVIDTAFSDIFRDSFEFHKELNLDPEQWEFRSFGFNDGYSIQGFPIISVVLAKRGNLQQTLFSLINRSNIDIESKSATRRLLILYRKAYRMMASFTSNHKKTKKRKGFDRWGFHTKRTYWDLTVFNRNTGERQIHIGRGW